ncbi:Membrane protein of ER body protein [Spatholobus suberectus]|nr:Membrane protein of ER body protein [Spatholobus suberectus]
MEVTVTQWNEAENEVEEVGLQRRQVLQRSSTNSSGSSSNKDIEAKGGGLEFDESETKEKFDISGTEVHAERILQYEDTETSTILPASDLPLPEDFTSLKNVTSQIGIVGTMKENDKERQELYLERVFQIPPTHGFYCPNCKSCIQKVYIQKGEWEQINAPTETLQPTEQIRCASCFSFLIPIGSWLFPGLVSDDKGAALKSQGTSQYEAPKPDQSEEQMKQSVAEGTTKSATKIADDKGKQSLQAAEEVIPLGLGPQKVATEVEDKTKKSEDSSSHLSATSEDQGKGQIAPKKKPFWSNWAVIKPKQPITAAAEATIPKQPEIDFPDEKQQEQIEVKIDEVDTGPTEKVVPAESTLVTRREPTVPASSRTLEILKSIVYGGLVESLASLSVVISAASADATTLNIVALAIANLIGGLFILGHNLGELKSEQPKRAENDTDVQVDRYNELLGQRENFFLHAFIAVLSFIVFGLVPPVVYGFSFRESDDKDFKLAAVAGASLICVTLLSIAKAYTKRPNSYLTYIQTVLYYVGTGAVASVLAYIAGDLVKKLIEKLGWFESTSNYSALQISGISEQFRWGSY